NQVLKKWTVAFAAQAEIDDRRLGAERRINSSPNVKGSRRRAAAIDVHGQNSPRSRCPVFQTIGESPKDCLGHRLTVTGARNGGLGFAGHGDLREIEILDR